KLAYYVVSLGEVLSQELSRRPALPATSKALGKAVGPGDCLRLGVGCRDRPARLEIAGYHTVHRSNRDLACEYLIHFGKAPLRGIDQEPGESLELLVFVFASVFDRCTEPKCNQLIGVPC